MSKKLKDGLKKTLKILNELLTSAIKGLKKLLESPMKFVVFNLLTLCLIDLASAGGLGVIEYLLYNFKYVMMLLGGLAYKAGFQIALIVGAFALLKESRKKK